DREATLGTYDRNVAAPVKQPYIHFGHWDIAPEPGTEAATLPPAQLRLDAILRSMAALEDGLTIVDAGCGFGGTLHAVHDSFPHASLHGINIDPRQLALARGSESSIEW